MFSLIKQMFIVLLSFSKSLSSDQTKYGLLNDKPCMIWPTLTDCNPVELKYYPFIINVMEDKFNGSCSVLSPKICVQKKKQ